MKAVSTGVLQLGIKPSKLQFYFWMTKKQNKKGKMQKKSGSDCLTTSLKTQLVIVIQSTRATDPQRLGMIQATVKTEATVQTNSESKEKKIGKEIGKEKEKRKAIQTMFNNTKNQQELKSLKKQKLNNHFKRTQLSYKDQEKSKPIGI